MTPTLDSNLIMEAARMTGISDNTTLLQEALRALLEREAARRLAALGGSAPDLEVVPRRRAAAAN